MWRRADPPDNMTPPMVHSSERRQFIRVSAEVPVRFKFIETGGEKRDASAHEGTTTNLSAAGMLLLGKVPVLAWIIDLLTQKLVMGVNLLLPGDERPVRALARVVWVETIDEATQRCAMGVLFREIEKEDQDRIFRFVIRSQMA